MYKYVKCSTKTLKQDIEELLTLPEGVVKLNAFAYLRRWTSNFTNPYGLDKLSIEFEPINGVRYGIYDNEIWGRTYNDIILECCVKFDEFFQQVSYETTQALKGGHR